MDRTFLVQGSATVQPSLLLSAVTKMLSSVEIARVLEEIPSGYKLATDDFFASANKSLLKEYQKLGVISNTDDELIVGGNLGTAEAKYSTEIYCNVPGCLLIFDGVAAYQAHYNSVHRFLCSECKKSLPTEHLLDLHISEQHDSYFAARVARGDCMYACYLEECKELMKTPADRKEHCIKEHKFPANFRFDQVASKNSSSGDSKKKTREMGEVLDPAEIDNVGLEKCNEHKVKAFSFGHQKERTFRTKGGQRSGSKNATKILENMSSLKEALDDVM